MGRSDPRGRFSTPASRRGAAGRRVRSRLGQDAATGPRDWLFIERSRVTEPVVVEVDRPLAYRPRVVGFWRGMDFHVVTRLVATRREHDATYYRVVTDRGAFDIRNIRRMDPRTLRIWRAWELCAELDAVPLARLP